MSLVFGLIFSVSILAADDLPEVTEEGLHLIKDSKLGVVYAKPGVDLGVYNRIWLVDATVAFKKNWKRDQNRTQTFKVNARDMERIKAELAELFSEVFAAKLTEGGYELATEAGDDVLIVRPAIVNLDVSAPDVRTASRSYQLTESAGEMTLYVELYDSVTSDIIAKAMDRQKDRERGFMQWQSKVSNKAAAKKILNNWADTLVNALAEAHSASGDADADQQ
jgi:hypothetical protein